MQTNKIIYHISNIMALKCICFVLLLGANYSYAASINLTKRSANDNLLFDLFKELFEAKCHEEKNITDVLSATAKCLKQYFPASTNDLKNNVNLDALSQICSDSKEIIKVKNCFNEFNGLVQECTVPAEEYIKDFMMEAIEKVIDAMCNGTTGAGGIPLYRVLYTPEAIECLEMLSSNTNNECNQLQIFNSHTTITKSILCGDLDQRNNCYSNYLSQQCPAAHNLNKFLTETTKSMKSPCLVRIPFTPAVKVTPKPIPEVRPKHSYSSQSYPLYYESPVIQNPLPIFSQPSNTLAGGAGLVLLPSIGAISLPLFIG